MSRTAAGIGADTLRDARKRLPIGWLPPVIWDIAIDEFRVATQADIDEMASFIQHAGPLILKILELTGQALDQIKAAKAAG